MLKQRHERLEKIHKEGLVVTYKDEKGQTVTCHLPPGAKTDAFLNVVDDSTVLASSAEQRQNNAKKKKKAVMSLATMKRYVKRALANRDKARDQVLRAQQQLEEAQTHLNGVTEYAENWVARYNDRVGQDRDLEGWKAYFEANKGKPTPKRVETAAPTPVMVTRPAFPHGNTTVTSGAYEATLTSTSTSAPSFNFGPYATELIQEMEPTVPQDEAMSEPPEGASDLIQRTVEAKDIAAPDRKDPEIKADLEEADSADEAALFAEDESGIKAEDISEQEAADLFAPDPEELAMAKAQKVLASVIQAEQELTNNRDEDSDVMEVAAADS